MWAESFVALCKKCDILKFAILGLAATRDDCSYPLPMVTFDTCSLCIGLLHRSEQRHVQVRQPIDALASRCRLLSTCTALPCDTRAPCRAVAIGALDHAVLGNESRGLVVGFWLYGPVLALRTLEARRSRAKLSSVAGVAVPSKGLDLCDKVIDHGGTARAGRCLHFLGRGRVWWCHAKV
jgi:hypothetical protein